MIRLIRETTVRETVEQYVDDVLSGAIIACKTVIQAVKKYRSERADPDFPFTFDEKRATREVRFFPDFLCHSIGEWADDPFELSPWQAFCVWNIYGWLRPDGTRRIRKLILVIARKNGKSTFIAGLAIKFGAADCEPGAQVFIGATKIEQARIVFDEAERMVRGSKFIFKHAAIIKNKISFPRSHSFIKPLGSDKAFDGLNPHCTVFDEFHAYKEHHRPFVDTLSTGGGSRSQPIIAIITTAADDKALLYHEEIDYARDVLSGAFLDHSLFVMIYELDKDDDPFAKDFDESILIKSNPNLGVSCKPEYLTQKLVEARNKPQSKNVFMRYHGNCSVSSVEDAIDIEIWDACAGPMSNWDDAYSVGIGVDLGGWDDLASFGMTARFEVDLPTRLKRDKTCPVCQEKSDPNDDVCAGGCVSTVFRYESKTRSFIAEDTERDLNAEPFRTWIENGDLTVAEYVVTELKTGLIEEALAIGIQMVAYDPFGAAQLSEELEQEGMIAVKMPQTHTHFNEIVKEYLTAISEGRFKPDESDVVLRWAASNMALKSDSQKRVMPAKSDSKEKIDPAVAMLMSMKACNSAPARCTGSLYTTG